MNSLEQYKTLKTVSRKYDEETGTPTTKDICGEPVSEYTDKDENGIYEFKVVL